MRKRSMKYSVVALILILVVLTAGFACNQVKTAAVGVNKYAESLSHFQDAEIIAHNQGRVGDVDHVNIQKALKKASAAGRALDSAIAAAETGNGSPQSYVDQANQAFNELVTILKPTNNQDLITLADAAGMLLKDAITFIQAIKPAKAPAPAAMWLLLSFGVMGMAAAGGLGGALTIIQLILGLEPVAQDLIMKLIASLQGKTTDEVLAMNEQLFGKVDATADAEIAKTPTPPAA